MFDAIRWGEPLFLLAIPLCLLPLLLTLIFRPKLTVIRFGAMRILEIAIAKTKKRFLRHDRFLIFLRMCIIALIVLALAQPQAVNIAQSPKILIVDGRDSAERKPSENAAFDFYEEDDAAAVYFRLAFESLDVSVKSVDSRKFGSVPLFGYDVIVLADIADFSRIDEHAIMRFQKSGGTIIFAPGTRTIPNSWRPQNGIFVFDPAPEMRRSELAISPLFLTRLNSIIHHEISTRFFPFTLLLYSIAVIFMALEMTWR